jgi:ribosomal protein S3
MGQKVHPYGFRLGVNKPWRSRWFSERDYAKLLVEDVKLKAELREKLKAAGVSSVEIERPGNKLRFLIRTARPGIVIGRKGAEIEKLKTELGKRTSRDVFIDIIEVNKPELDAQLVSENIALQLEKRVSFPPRHAQERGFGAALRLQGNQGARVGPLERQRNRALGVVSAGPFAAAHAARRHRLRVYRGAHDVWRDRREDLDLSRRHLRAEAASDAGGGNERVLKFSQFRDQFVVHSCFAVWL